MSGTFDPKAYTFFDHFDNRSVEFAPGEFDVIDPVCRDTVDKVEGSGHDIEHCTHCGSALLQGNVLQHNHSGEFIVMGETCADRLGFESLGELKETLRTRRLYVLGLRKAMKRNFKWRIVGGYLEGLKENEALTSETRRIAEDMLRKLAKWFSLSRKQIAFMRRLEREDSTRKARQEVEALKRAGAPDWEPGRFEVSGLVLALKLKDAGFGPSWKMLVELEDGRKCWGSVPKWFEGEKGDSIEFLATFEASREDSKFAFFKRPAKLKK